MYPRIDTLHSKLHSSLHSFLLATSSASWQSLQWRVAPTNPVRHLSTKHRWQMHVTITMRFSFGPSSAVQLSVCMQTFCMFPEDYGHGQIAQTHINLVRKQQCPVLVQSKSAADTIWQSPATCNMDTCAVKTCVDPKGTYFITLQKEKVWSSCRTLFYHEFTNAAAC